MNRPRKPMSKRRLSAVPGTSLFRKITTGLLLTFSSLPFTHAEDAPAAAVDPATICPPPLHGCPRRR